MKHIETILNPIENPNVFIGFGAMDVTKPYEFIGFGAMDITKPCEFIGCGAHSGVGVVFNLPSFRINDTNYNFDFGFWPVSGRTWPRDPFKLVGLEEWCRNHPQLAPETSSKAVS